MFFSFVIKSSFALTSLSNCAVLSTPGETYVLTQDIVNSTNTTCFNITANNIVLDCQGHLVDGDGTNGVDGIRILRAMPENVNITIKNCSFQDWFNAGIYTLRADNVTIENCTFMRNQDEGIEIEDSWYYLIKDVEFRNGGDDGIFVYGKNFARIAAYITIENVRSYNNSGEAIQIWDTYNSTIKNYESVNDYVGIDLNPAYNVTVINATIKNAIYSGIRLSGDNNTITDSIITNSSTGIRICVANYNLIYDNLFNNTVNFNSSGCANIGSNYFNTTKQSGTNIMGGNYIGGNFWAKPDVTGFSETCADSDYDSICDQAYNVTTDSACTPGVDCGDNTDYLPLTTPEPVQLLIRKPDSYEILYNPQSEKITAKVGTCEVTSPYSIPKTEFSKISVTCCKGNLLKLYIDSSLVNVSSCSNIPGSSNPIYVGGSPSGNYFKGTIDEIRISNSSISESLITYYNALNILFYNPSRETLNGFYILAKISGKNILQESSQIIYPGSFGLLSILVPEGKVKIEVTPKNCQISVEYQKEVECR